MKPTMLYYMNPIATAVKDEQTYINVCLNVVDHINGHGSPMLEKLMKDYVHPNAAVVRNHYQSLVAFAREKALQAKNTIEITKKLVNDYRTKECSSKIELKQKLQILDEIEEKQTTETKQLKARYKQMDKATEEIIRNLEEENRVAKEKQLKKLEFLQGSNPILANLEDDI